MNNDELKALDEALDYLNESSTKRKHPKIVYKESFKDSEKRKTIEKEVNKEVDKILKNEDKLITEIYYKMKNETHKENWKNVYFNEIEIDDPENSKDKFDLWAHTSREQYAAKIKNGKILKIEFLS
jgi:hypothetical protein